MKRTASIVAMETTMTEKSNFEDGYRIRCLECGSMSFGDTENEPEFDKEYHRDHYCEGAEFEVTPL
jgi:hypothetical protein